MKRILLPAALAFATTLTFAQAPQDATQAPAPIQRTAPDGAEGPAHHHRDPHKAAQRMAKQLNLTADQTAKLEPILATREQKINDLNANTSLSPKDRHRQMHAIQADTQQQLATVLSPDQMEQMKSMKKGHHGKDRTEPMTPPSA